MPRISNEEVQKREGFLRSVFQKAKAKGDVMTAAAANDAVSKQFGAKIRSARVYSIRDEVYGTTRKDKKAAQAKAHTAPSAPTTAKRGPGRPRKIVAAPVAERSAAGLFVVKGDMGRVAKMAEAAGVPFEVDEPATQSLTALMAHG